MRASDEFRMKMCLYIVRRRFLSNEFKEYAKSLRPGSSFCGSKLIKLLLWAWYYARQNSLPASNVSVLWIQVGQRWRQLTHWCGRRVIMAPLPRPIASAYDWPVTRVHYSPCTTASMPPTSKHPEARLLLLQGSNLGTDWYSSAQLSFGPKKLAWSKTQTAPLKSNWFGLSSNPGCFINCCDLALNYSSNSFDFEEKSENIAVYEPNLMFRSCSTSWVGKFSGKAGLLLNLSCNLYF